MAAISADFAKFESQGWNIGFHFFFNFVAFNGM
jgi:hypothetical protein